MKPINRNPLIALSYLSCLLLAACGDESTSSDGSVGDGVADRSPSAGGTTTPGPAADRGVADAGEAASDSELALTLARPTTTIPVSRSTVAGAVDVIAMSPTGDRVATIIPQAGNTTDSVTVFDASSGTALGSGEADVPGNIQRWTADDVISSENGSVLDLSTFEVAATTSGADGGTGCSNSNNGTYDFQSNHFFGVVGTVICRVDVAADTSMRFDFSEGADQSFSDFSGGTVRTAIVRPGAAEVIVDYVENDESKRVVLNGLTFEVISRESLSAREFLVGASEDTVLIDELSSMRIDPGAIATPASGRTSAYSSLPSTSPLGSYYLVPVRNVAGASFHSVLSVIDAATGDPVLTIDADAFEPFAWAGDESALAVLNGEDAEVYLLE